MHISYNIILIRNLDPQISNIDWFFNIYYKLLMFSVIGKNYYEFTIHQNNENMHFLIWNKIYVVVFWTIIFTHWIKLYDVLSLNFTSFLALLKMSIRIAIEYMKYFCTMMRQGHVMLLILFFFILFSLLFYYGTFYEPNLPKEYESLK